MYVLFETLRQGNFIFYIGSSANLRNRLYFHLTAKKSAVKHFNEFYPHGRGKYRVWRKWGDWATDEIRLVWRIRPTGNKQVFYKPGTEPVYDEE